MGNLKILFYSLAKGAKTQEEALVHYIRVRGEIRHFVERLPDAIRKKESI